ncbi:hypothetical protein ACF05L_35885 [Streptomyces bobili]|uniref:hypothetical protein n=1 Tax=Streptomyces bobili TaxID=67280 RepID=UPI0036F59AFE
MRYPRVVRGEVPRDAASVRAFAHAAAGLPWVLRQRSPVPPEIEHRIALLKRARRSSPARQYVSTSVRRMSVRARRRGHGGGGRCIRSPTLGMVDVFGQDAASW